MVRSLEDGFTERLRELPEPPPSELVPALRRAYYVGVVCLTSVTQEVMRAVEAGTPRPGGAALTAKILTGLRRYGPTDLLLVALAELGAVEMGRIIRDCEAADVNRALEAAQAVVPELLSRREA